MKINCAWDTIEYPVFPLNLYLKGNKLKNQEQDKHMVNMMNQMDLMMMHVMESVSNAINVLCTNRGVNINYAYFEAIYIKEV